MEADTSSFDRIKLCRKSCHFARHRRVASIMLLSILRRQLVAVSPFPLMCTTSFNLLLRSAMTPLNRDIARVSRRRVSSSNTEHHIKLKLLGSKLPHPSPKFLSLAGCHPAKMMSRNHILPNKMPLKAISRAWRDGCR